MITIDDLSVRIKDNTSLSDSSIYKYSHAVNTISKEMYQKGIIPVDLFSMSELQCDIYLPIILHDPDFLSKNITGNNMYSNALKQYRMFRNATSDKLVDQAEVSWECVLNKREAFRKAFDGFDAEKIAFYDDNKIAELQSNKDIIRNKLKIRAAVSNAKIFLEIQKEYGSFREYLKVFTGEQQIIEIDKTTSPLSDALSADLQKRGMKFVGSTIIYSYLQAVGVISSHEEECFMYKGK